MNRLLRNFICILSVTSSSHLYAELSIERIFDSPSLSGNHLRNVQVSPDGNRVTFIKGKDDDYERYDLWEYNIAESKTRLLFDSDDLHSGDEQLSDEEKARRERMRLSGTGIVQYTWSNDGKALLFPLAGDVYYYKIGSDKAEKLLDTPQFETDIKFSPDGQYISFVREQNLYILNIQSKKETAITTEGGGDIKFAMAEFVAQEEMSRMTGYWWSPDSKNIALTKVDESPVMTITRSEIYADVTSTIEQKYPKAGTNNVEIKLAIVNIAKGNKTWIDLGENKDIYLARAKWRNNKNLTFQIQSRDQKQLKLHNFDLSSSQTSTLIEEVSDTWINLHNDLLFLQQENQFVWASERDGFKHLYLYDNQGKLLKQLTSGTWVVEAIKGKHDNNLFIQARKDTTLESHLYSLDLETLALNRLTELGWHNASQFSRDGSIYINTKSNVNTPPQTSIHKNDGSQLTWLVENQVNRNHPLNTYKDEWIKPVFGTFTSKDNIELSYRLYTPKNIKTTRPVIVYVYGGPGVQVVNNRWGYGRGLMMQYWAQQGYVVFSLDNRGAKKYGKAFEDPIYRNMGSVEVDDQVAGVEFLKTLPYVDPERIGIFGHSYGGYMALMSMFKASDYFAAGVSGAPVTDWRLYDTHYTERYMGDPRQVDDLYTASSVFPYAEQLKGKLLIYHGMADDNVLFTHSTMLYKHLQDKAILFESMDYPGKKHSIRGKNTTIHRYKLITDFFDRHMSDEK